MRFLSTRMQQFSRVPYWGVVVGGTVGACLLSFAAQASPLSGLESMANQAMAQVVSGQTLQDGVYFLGMAPRPDELGMAYLVFEARNSEVVGAFFMPYSSFDCFQGTVANNQLAMTITNSYTQETYDYAIALVNRGDAVATLGTPDLPLQLDGFYDLGMPREGELSILETCQANLTP